MNNIKPFVIKRNDTLPLLSINVTARGEFNEVIPFSLTGVTACTFSMSDDSGNLKVSSATAQILIASAGTIQYVWTSYDTDTDGSYNGEFEMIFTGGQKMSVPSVGVIEIKILKDINSA